MSYVNNFTQRSDGIRFEDDLAIDAGIFDDALRNHNGIGCGRRQVLEDQVHHLAQRRVLVLEELRDAEEEVRRFLWRELLLREKEERDLGEQDSAVPSRDGGFVEDPS